MQLRFLLLATALLGAALVSASSSEHVLKLTDADFAEKTADGKVRPSCWSDDRHTSSLVGSPRASQRSQTVPVSGCRQTRLV